MKTTTLAVALLLVVATAYATEKDKSNSKSTKKTVAVINNSPEKFKLVYLQKEEGVVKISLKNEYGQTVHNSTVKNKEGFAQPYDLKELPAGEYTFEVTSPDGTEIAEKVMLEKPARESKLNFAADVLNVNDGKKFRLAVVNKDKRALPTYIKLYDAKDNLIHEEKIENLYGFRKTFDLSELNGDVFRFTVSNNTGTKSIFTE
ncbi:hypothetical protein E1176_19620 [Fulvivirga sp. RKSG066]|uniref:hypothetical protein n=1 Tax=Fulvivirga aurantia TaxID=2529383 RepID=UPI0012BC86AD|nr:hypothetical protein [Fulvivirga aurantia]MTI23247.1 hypothetical protein [Fulvivirga aurantia]